MCRFTNFYFFSQFLFSRGFQLNMMGFLLLPVAEKNWFSTLIPLGVFRHCEFDEISIIVSFSKTLVSWTLSGAPTSATPGLFHISDTLSIRTKLLRSPTCSHFAVNTKLYHIGVIRGSSCIVVRAFGLYWAVAGSNLSQLTIVGP